ncbi:Gfo/Idh/MocA family oxidoreductase [Neobacillus niacini]|uniref:Gfo/Idh/MocA family protein n=1 Tax=Neobacillus niacini TaxID=86668 RepID=UPI00052F7F78|nr:Gfo/Idh/MocA family oxidoreductase [Neobacillus niacini]KGM45969.1 oxidoreductase [Neobacillus niacini]MEC1522228.1 Gfo/Idh/MocA family oxidoreductase [Neobacillus niacini]
MKKVRVGFVGAGGIANVHLQHISKNEMAQVTAFCDIHEKTALLKAQEYGGAAYTKVDEMLEKEPVDALFISVPPFAHGDIEEKAARKGIHLMVEKPLGLDYQKTAKKAEIIKQSGIICGVGYCLRYLDTVARAKEYLLDKKPAMVRGHYLSSFVTTPWYREWEKSGGQLVEQSTHIVDLARYLGGEIKQVYANMSLQVHSDVPNITIPDVTSMNFVYDSGAVGHIDSTFAQFDHRTGMEVMGEDFRVVIDGGNLTIIEKDSTISFKSEVDFYEEQDRMFIEAIVKGDQNLLLSSFEDGLKTLAVTLAANQSHEKGLPVKVSSITSPKITWEVK